MQHRVLYFFCVFFYKFIVLYFNVTIKKPMLHPINILALSVTYCLSALVSIREKTFIFKHMYESNHENTYQNKF